VKGRGKSFSYNIKYHKTITLSNVQILQYVYYKIMYMNTLYLRNVFTLKIRYSSSDSPHLLQAHGYSKTIMFNTAERYS